MRKQWLFLLIAALASLTLWGCGSSGGSGGSDVMQESDIANVEMLGVANCDKCHSDVVSDWATGHGNDSNYPDLSYFGNDPAECETCHNPSGEGETLPLALGGDARPVIGCEECHGGGSAHRGIGPLPHEWPDYEQCASCHDNTPSHHTKVGYALATAVGNSAHNNSDDLHASATRCQRCHTTEGALLLSKYTGDADVMHLMDEDQDNIPPIAAEEDLHPVTCAACHDAHTGELRADSFIKNDNSLASGDWDPNESGTADQFDFCTSCHTYWNQDIVLTGSGDTVFGNPTAPFYHNTAWYRTVTTTHYDSPTTTDIIEGYVIREDSANPCFDCHNHEFRTNTRRSDQDADPNDPDLGPTIHSQWASSGHAGQLLAQVRTAADAVDCDPNDPDTSRGRCPDIVTAAMEAGVDSTTGDGWVHFDWDQNFGGFSGSGFIDCQKCHTSTGYVSYTADPGSYDPATNDFSHLVGWDDGVSSSDQNEMLYCWGCHDNTATGTMRQTDAVTADYTLGGSDVDFPDVSASNACIVCHAGLGNNETVSTSSRFAGHHGPAAAVIYSSLTNVAYEYPGQDYSDKPYFAHDAIDTDDAGPCVACHMNNDAADHTFGVVEKDDSGVITAIRADVCVECHDGEHALFVGVDQIGTTQDIWNGTAAVPTVVTQQMVDDAADVMEEESEGYQEAGAIANELLANTIANYKGFLIDEGTADVDGDLGAFQNAKLPAEEPGGYAHNRYYVKRALFDAIDWLEDGSIDGTIADYSATYPDGAHWLGTSRP